MCYYLLRKIVGKNLQNNLVLYSIFNKNINKIEIEFIFIEGVYMKKALAIDMGATSIRGIIGYIEDGKVKLRAYR